MAKTSKRNNPVKKEKIKREFWWMNKRVVASIVAIVAFLLYSNSLTNGFVLDDSLVITNNSFTTQGIGGINDIFSHDTFKGFYGESADQLKVIGGRYRPLSVAFFAFIYQIAGANAFVFHFWNVLLYCICCVILYLVVRQIFEPVLGMRVTAAFSAATALLFAVHPVHTEVVNNIKSNDEILCLILSLLSLSFAIKYWDLQKRSFAYMSGAALFLGCLAKENAVVFLAIIPFTLYFRGAVLKNKSVSSIPLLISLGGAFIFYFLIRYSVLGWSLGETPLDLINNPFIKFNGETWEHVSMHEKLAMTFLALGKYLQLLVIPLALSTDYYPRYIDVVTFSNPWALLSLIAYLSLGFYALYRLMKGQKKVHVYGITFFLISLSIVSNLVFPVGTNLAERFLFTPSVGFCIAIAGLVIPFMPGEKQKVTTIFSVAAGIVLIVLATRTFVRNDDFESNRTLFFKDIQVSENSAKIQNAVGALIAEDALNTQDPTRKTQLSIQAMDHLNKALSIHPTYLEAYYMRGNVNFMLGRYEDAVQDYRRTITLNENFKDAYPNYALALREAARVIMESNGDLKTAEDYLEESLRLYPDEKETQALLERARTPQQTQ